MRNIAEWSKKKRENNRKEDLLIPFNAIYFAFESLFFFMKNMKYELVFSFDKNFLQEFVLFLRIFYRINNSATSLHKKESTEYYLS